jgi:hypothetical protein
MPKKSDDLVAAMNRLEQVLGDESSRRDEEWLGCADEALRTVEESVRLHLPTLRPADGKLIEVDRPRLPSPMVSRRADELYGELHGFLNETQALRTMLHGSDGSSAPNFGAFRQRARQLVEALQQYEEEEANLILESVNTDIGAGD